MSMIDGKFKTLEVYARENHLDEDVVVQMIKDGTVVGKKQDDQWFVDIILSRKLRVENEDGSSIKKGRKNILAWAFSGGIYAGGIKGGGLGSFGIASIIAGGGNVWKIGQSVSDYDEAVRVLGWLAFFVILGIIFIGMGYYRYLTCRESEMYK